MKKVLSIISLQLLVFVGYAQTAEWNNVATQIANRMADSLQLTPVKRDSIYAINLWLHERKTGVRQQFTDPDSLRIHINRVERLRDSLYRPILGDDKYSLYKQKKTALLTIN